MNFIQLGPFRAIGMKLLVERLWEINRRSTFMG